MTLPGCKAKLRWCGDAFPCDGVPGHPGLHACLISALGRHSGSTYEIALYWASDCAKVLAPWQPILSRDEVQVEGNI